MRLYIADDNCDFARFCAKVAKREGWEVSVSADGQALLDALETEPGPALLLIDMQMPEKDGIEVVEPLSRHAASFRLRFITGGPETTAFAASKIAQVRDLSVGNHLTKPIGVDALKKVLLQEAKVLKCA